MDVSVIGVPIFFGSDRKGTEYGPRKLRQKKLIYILNKSGHTIYDTGDIPVLDIPESEKYTYNSHMKYLKPILNANKNLAHQVYSSLCAHSFPLTIGGDHSIGLGSLSGTSKYNKNIAVVWLDAHGDINTDKTSPSGNVHGMPLSAAMGFGYDKLSDLYYKGPKVKPQNVFILGARSLDKGELDFLKEQNINIYSTRDIHAMSIKNVMEEIGSKLKRNGVQSLHFSFDIDVLSPQLVPGTGTPVKKGINVIEVKYILKYLMETGLVKSMDMVELNPKLDENDKTSDLCIDLLSWTFQHLK
ncbi:arginase [Clostridium ljungdahlii]|uniref:Arginase n=1 Tax=Clostridium ljungdahlii TaxID=1538 RepID=A0A162LDK2_9CLOT|nr:arginase [Clostridium ljungdahlii]OAA92116.1 Arginase [Clostridium ljungdahlii]